MVNTVVIAGAGHGAGQVVATLKQKRFAGKIILIGDEAQLPYQRPPLSKKFLSGDLDAERLHFKPPSFYDDPQIDVHLNTRIERIDRAGKEVIASDGVEFTYDKLVLALGSRVRKIEVPGHDLPGIHYLRSIADAEAIRSKLSGNKNVVIVGAGYIGLEVAAVCRQRGLDVTVVEIADRVLSRVVSPNVSDYYQLEHTKHGVKLLLSTGLAAFEGKRHVKRVITDDGQEIPADFAVVGDHLRTAVTARVGSQCARTGQDGRQ